MHSINKEFNPSIFHPGYLIRKNLLRNLIKNKNLVKGKVMDLGCGSKPYKSLFNFDEYIGVDIDNNPGHPHDNEDIDVYYNGKDLPFENDTFDTIFCSEVFEHVFELESLLEEIYRVLKTGGILLFTCPFSFPEHEQPNDYARYTSFSMKYLLEKKKFKNVNVLKSGTMIESIGQLKVLYFHHAIIPKFRKIPVLRQIIRMSGYLLINGKAAILSKLLPNSDTLYLNNIVNAQK
ncbi:class I SAM-dependent methyltransferase [Polluticaenibacter yanchengensis]|uniref:Class I SAM-dependent methyltransferase n=1 Tax=Polluticaenibacter yanchengensis TaxID=3014562 RepID=A0ABT4ULB9_9BACT|nr:class I SAM-dependent methyltransferase [Chitinophagaceae bacterium LY-5]